MVSFVCVFSHLICFKENKHHIVNFLYNIQSHFPFQSLLCLFEGMVQWRCKSSFFSALSSTDSLLVVMRPNVEKERKGIIPIMCIMFLSGRRCKYHFCECVSYQICICNIHQWDGIIQDHTQITLMRCGRLWLRGRVAVLQPEGRQFDPQSSTSAC